MFSFFFFFNDTATTEIYTLSLHDALPIFAPAIVADTFAVSPGTPFCAAPILDRKSTRLNSSHTVISYAVFCLKKKKIGQDALPIGAHGEHGVLQQTLHAHLRDPSAYLAGT